MTIREHITRQFWKTAALLVTPVAVFELVAHHLPDVSLNSPWVWVLMAVPLGALICEVWGFYQLTAVVCPRCRAWLFFDAASVAFGRAVHRCPKCRVRFDEPMDRS